MSLPPQTLTLATLDHIDLINYYTDLPWKYIYFSCQFYVQGPRLVAGLNIKYLSGHQKMDLIVFPYLGGETSETCKKTLLRYQFKKQECAFFICVHSNNVCILHLFQSNF